jgi:uncharacterized protein YecT (DUF1311 family)
MQFPSGHRVAFAPVVVLFVALAFALTCSQFQAQQPAPDAPGTAGPQQDMPPPPPGPPPQVSLQNLIPPDQLAFLNDYANDTPKSLLKDKRYKNLMKQAIPHTEYHYGTDKSLQDASEELLATDAIPITVRSGRFVTISTRGGSYLAGKTMMWFDMQSGIALGVIYFHPTNGEPSPTLTVFSRQMTDTSLSMSQLPEEFVADLSLWERATRIPAISPRYFIPANGKKYVLVHDEDYCFHPQDEPAPDGCDQDIADAADDDMNAAYFMQETHNAANATAWMLEPDQIEWLAVRDRTCGGPGNYACRIEITRRRTSVLIGHPVPVPRGGGGAPHLGQR